MDVLKKLSQEELNQLYEFGSFFVLNHVPVGTQFSIDGSFWLTGPKFQGIKLIPPGFHIITISPGAKPSTSSNSGDKGNRSCMNETMKIGYELRSGIIRFFQPREKVIRDYDCNTESFKSEKDTETSEEVITSLEYMKSIDSNLAPYPFEKYERWRSITHLITVEQVSNIIGINHHGDALLDSSITNHTNLSPHPPSSSSTTRTQWGKPRDVADHPSPNLHTTFWPFVDVQRSWPKGAVGAELTKWSRDKSWLLNNVMHHQLKGDPNECLGLLQLSFITFIEIQSIQSFEFYQILLNLISQSSLAELSTLEEKIETEAEGVKEQEDSGRSRRRIDYLQMRLSVIKLYGDQLRYLSQTFFSESMEDFQIENWFFKVLDRFRKDLDWIYKHMRNLDGGESSSLSARGIEKAVEWIDWPGIQVDCRRFDWNVKRIKFGSPEEGESEESDPDDDESQPVIV